jgi:phosphomannomutase
MSELLGELEAKYFISGEINSRVADTQVVLQRLAEHYADGTQETLDGISVSYPSWHFNVRTSNTEPLIRLNLESIASRSEMEQRRDEVLALIRG